MAHFFQVVPNWDAPRTGSVSIKLRTTEPDGLLLFSQGGSTPHVSTLRVNRILVVVSLLLTYEALESLVGLHFPLNKPLTISGLKHFLPVFPHPLF